MIRYGVASQNKDVFACNHFAGQLRLNAWSVFIKPGSRARQRGLAFSLRSNYHTRPDQRRSGETNVGIGRPPADSINETNASVLPTGENLP